MNRTQGEQPAYVPYPSSFGFADVSPSSAAFRTHLSAHPPAAHVRIEHGPPGPRLQFVPVRTAPIVGHLRLGNPIETFSRHTDSAADFVGAERAMEVFMAELSEDEKQSLDDALSTLDDLYEATLKADGGFHSEETEAIAKLAEEVMACVLSVLDPEMYDAVQRDCPGKNLGREARRFAVQARRGLDWWRLDRGSHRRLDCLSRVWLHRRSVGGTADDQRLLSRSLSRDREPREGKIQITFRTPPAQATSGAPRGSVIFQNSFLPLGCMNVAQPLRPRMAGPAR